MKRLLIFALLAALILPVAGQEESRILLGNLMKPKLPAYAFVLNQNLRTTDSPTFAGLTLSGSTASTLAYLNASKAFTSLANGAGYLLNDGSGGLSWGAVDLSPYVEKDGTTKLTADWNVGAFDLTANNFTADPTLSAEALTNVAGWTVAGNWTYGGGKWSHTTGSATALTATGETAIVAGTKYEIVMTITTSTAGGGLAVSLGGQTFAAVSTGAPTTYTYNVTAASTAALAITPTSGTWVGSIDSISVKIVTNGQLVSEGLTLNSGQLFLSTGNATYPALAFANGYGLYLSQVNRLQTAINGANVSYWYSGGFKLESGMVLSVNNTVLGEDSTGVLQIGVDAAAPVDQAFKAADGTGTDKPGASFYLQGGQSTGTGISGSVIQQTGYVAGTGSTANTYYTRQHIDGKVHSVANNTATAMFSIACADGNAVGGYINYTVEVTDGTDIQIESGTFTFAATNKAVETWVTDADKGTFSQAVSASTLAVTWAVDTATADTLKVTVNSNSGLTPTSSKVQFQIFLNSPKVITIL